MDIVELHLMTDVLAAQRAFYVETFALTLLTDDQESFAVQVGHTRLVFAQASPATSAPWYHFAFNIPENLLAEAKRWLSQRTRLLPIDDSDEVYFEEWNAHACYFHDPAGNIVEFIA
jgi:catechol-2,3-dioxygenase